MSIEFMSQSEIFRLLLGEGRKKGRFELSLTLILYSVYLTLKIFSRNNDFFGNPFILTFRHLFSRVIVRDEGDLERCWVSSLSGPNTSSK